MKLGSEQQQRTLFHPEMGAGRRRVGGNLPRDFDGE